MNRACTKCGEVKSDALFYKARNSKSGYQRECKECVKAKQRAWHIANREVALAKASEWRKKNIDRARESQSAWRAKNGKKVIQRVAAWQANNLDRVREYKAAYRKKSRAYYVAKCAERRAVKIKATPVWANDTEINQLYKIAAQRTVETGIEHQVDHIVPLRSKRVCGLHVEHNLRVITAAENLEKRNYHWPDMP